MPDLCLLIPDAALLGAVSEQLALTKIAAKGHATALPETPPTAPALLVLDEASCDAKTLKNVTAIKNDQLTILLLGTPPEGCDETLIAENFAKPLRLGHLLARLQFYIEVAPRLRSAPIAIGFYRLEAQQRCLKLGEEIVRLTEKETALLEYLAQSAEPVGREELLAAVWGYDARIDTHTLETHIYQLRRKMGGDKAGERGTELIINESGLYRLAR